MTASFVIAVAVSAAVQGGAAQDAPPLAVRYVANAGMLVTLGQDTFLFDAPLREGIPPYPTSPDDERRRLEGAEPPYNRVAAILITHWHEDHFSPEAVAAHLTHNGRAVLISSPEVVERVRRAAPALDAARLQGVLPDPGTSLERQVGRTTVHVLRIRHNPARRLPDQHVGFLLDGATTVLHAGDADPTAENFALLARHRSVDLALLPFWYVLTDANRRFVTASIAPRRVVAMHLPPGDAPKLARALPPGALRVAMPGAPGTPIALAP